VASAAARVIPLARHCLLILAPVLAGVEGEACVTVGAEASSNGRCEVVDARAKVVTDAMAFERLQEEPD
jgi:hypothetical protein